MSIDMTAMTFKGRTVPEQSRHARVIRSQVDLRALLDCPWTFQLLFFLRIE
jgi:hypothetical protein